MSAFAPQNQDQLEEVLSSALAAEQPLYLHGTGTKAALHEPVNAKHHVSMSNYSGIIAYEPEELVLDVKSGTPLEEVEQLLDQHNQMLAFEPLDLRAALKQQHKGTIGGVMATNLSGPRRLSAGAARDYLLGFTAVSGRAGIFKSGSRVMKNVTGYDLSKLMCGSYGTLAVMTDITLKVLPKPETQKTVTVKCDTLGNAQHVVARAYGMATEPSGGAIITEGDGFLSCIRLEGVDVSVTDRAATVKAHFEQANEVEILNTDDSYLLWSRITSLEPINLTSAGAGIWKISLTPDRLADFVDALMPDGAEHILADWAGGLVWLPGHSGNTLSSVRQILAECGGGHAHYISTDDHHTDIPAFQPQSNVQFALSQRIKTAFDPKYLLNPGVMGLTLERDDHSGSDKREN